MSIPLISLKVDREEHLSSARTRARRLSELLGFREQEQTSLATAVSEIARNALTYAGSGTVEFRLEGDKPNQAFIVRVADQGKGIENLEAILSESYSSRTGLGLGIPGTRRLMDSFLILSSGPSGTTVEFGKQLPPTAKAVGPDEAASILAKLAHERLDDTQEELKQQNHELLKALDDLAASQNELRRQMENVESLNEELVKTNAGMVALLKELEDKKVELEAANKELEGFSYSVSHDLRSPLHAIGGFTKILLSEYADKLDDNARRYLNIISRNSTRMGQLIEDLLNFSRLGRQPLSLMDLDLTEMSGVVFQEIKESVPGRDIRFRASPTPSARCDRSTMRQVLHNLIGNAVKFTKARPVAEIEFAHLSRDDETIYYVKDNGVGFNMSYADKLFSPFHRLHRQDEFPGTGIGLSLVQRIIHRLGGSVWAEAQEGEGATFYFSLPRRRPEKQ